MRFMIIVKATRDSEEGVMPSEKLIGEMASFHEELARAGVLVDGSGLQPTAKGWRIKYDGAERTMFEGPFDGAEELVAGYTIIDVASRDEAMAWSRRYPNPAVDGGVAEIEVRQFFELEDFGPGESIERFREIGIGTQ
jgi:hypothetical protein